MGSAKWGNGPHEAQHYVWLGSNPGDPLNRDRFTKGKESSVSEKKEELYSEKELCSIVQWVGQHTRYMLITVRMEEPRIVGGPLEELGPHPALLGISGMNLRRLSFKGIILLPLRIVERYELYVGYDRRWRPLRVLPMMGN